MTGTEVKEATSLEEKYRLLTADFPQEAFTIDRSRGFELVGLKGAFVIERLNEVFGLLGHGWRFAHAGFSEHIYKTRSGEGIEYVTEVVLQYFVGPGAVGTYPVRFIEGEWVSDQSAPPSWSEPVFGIGGNNVGRGTVPISDTKKGAVSNALSKAASRLGVGINAYKGKLVVDGEEVIVRGELPMVKQLQEADVVLSQTLKVLAKVDPDSFQELRSHEQVDRYFKDHVLDPMAEFIKKKDLTKFIGDHYKRILHNEKLKGFEGMTMREATFLADMIVMMVGSDDDFGWEDALEVSDTWDGKKSWDELYLSWIKSQEEKDGE